MIKLLDCTKELAENIIEAFDDYCIDADYNLNKGLYDVSFTDRFYTYTVNVHPRFITITRVPMHGDTCDDRISTVSINTDEFWKLEVI